MPTLPRYPATCRVGTLVPTIGSSQYFPLAPHNDIRYGLAMIRDFADKEAEGIWHGKYSRRLPGDIQPVARRKLRMLNNAMTLDDLRVPPANRLEPLKGNRKGQYSIRINDQWRICFTWHQGDAHQVAIVDYH